MGILTNDNFDVNAPKNIDSRYSVAGVTPYANVAAANAAISITRRAIGLTVNVAGVEYWYAAGITDPDLVIKSAAGGSSQVSITKAALLALIAANTVVVGTVYSVTDAQDALGGNITVLGVTINSVNGNGYWTFLGKLPAQGYFRLQSGTSGSVDQITVVMPTGTKNLMTASVPYTTSRNNTAALVVANINANTANSGCTAFVIPSPAFSGLDTPTIVVEAIETTTSFAHTMTVSLTTLVLSNNVNPTLGFTPNNLVLSSFYDVTNDRILRVYDAVNDCLVDCNLARIVTLTYNPVTTYRWRDPRQTSFALINSGYRFTKFSNANIAPFAWKNIRMTDTSISGVIFSNVSHNNVELYSGSVITNVNCTLVNITSSKTLLTLVNIEAGSFTVSFQSGNSVNIQNSNFGNATTKPTVTLSANSCPIIISNINYTASVAAFAMTSCIQIGILALSTLTIATQFTMTNVRLFSNFNLTNSATILLFSMVDSDIYQTFNMIGNVYSGNIIIARTKFIGSPGGTGFNLQSGTYPAITITDNTNIFVSLPNASAPTNFSITYCNIDSSTTFGKMTAGFTLANSNISQNTSLCTTFIGSALALNITSSNLKNTNLAKAKSIIISNSDIQNSSFTDPTNLILNTFNCSSSLLINADIQSDLYLGLGNVSINISQCIIISCVIFTNGVCNYSKCSIDNSTCSIGAPVTSIVTGCRIKNSIFKARTDLGVVNITSVDMFDSTVQDLIEAAGPGTFTNCTISKSSFFNTLINLNNDLSAWNTTITGCSIKDTALVDFNQAGDTILRNTTIDNGKYRIKYIYDFATVPLVVGTPFLISTLLKNFSYNNIVYTSGNSLIGTGAKLGLGVDTNYNEYINDLLITAINAANTVQTTGILDRLPSNTNMGLNATIANITSGKISLVIEGNMLE